MKPLLILALMFIVAGTAFAAGPQIVGSSHAESGYDHKDMAVAMLVSSAEKGIMWLNANHSYSLSGNSGARPLGVRRSAGSCRALWCAGCFPGVRPGVHCQPRRLAPRR